jgi:PP-loop superfamily ATP-utilizing enzyme
VGDLARLVEPQTRAAVVGRLRELGYVWVSVDLEGFAAGKNNRVLSAEQIKLVKRVDV